MQAVNPWGRQGGLEPQRVDLWCLDLSHAFDGVMGRLKDNVGQQVEYRNDALGKTMDEYANLVGPLAGDRTALKQYAFSVNLPELLIQPEIVRRDSRPYHVPGFDMPLSPIRVAFVHDISSLKGGPNGPQRSEIYAFLSLWRALVRAGRGEMSSEFALALDKNFCVNYGFDVSVQFFGGLDFKTAVSLLDATLTASQSQALDVTATYVLKNCWLSSFGLGELAYGGQGPVTINTVFYAEDIYAKDLDYIPTQ